MKFLKNKFSKNIEIFILISLIILTAISTSYYNYKKKINYNTYNNFIENIFLKKTLSHIIKNLEPKYKKVKHKIKTGETFDKILKSYSIEKNEINKIKNTIGYSFCIKNRTTILFQK